MALKVLVLLHGIPCLIYLFGSSLGWSFVGVLAYLLEIVTLSVPCASFSKSCPSWLTCYATVLTSSLAHRLQTAHALIVLIFWALCISTLFSQPSTSSMIMSPIFLVVSSLLISVVIISSFILLINYSFSHLLFYLELHSLFSFLNG